MKSLKPQFEMLRDWLKLAPDKPAIDQALRRFANAQGFEWFTYLSVHEADVYGMSNYPVAWQKHYLDSGLAKVDPVVEAVSPRRGAYAWWESGLPVPARKHHRTFFGEARNFGIRSGISIPIFDGFGRRALFTFSSRERKPDTTMLADPYSVLTLGAFVDGYLQSRDDQQLMSAAASPLTSYQLECLAWLLAGKTNDDIATLRHVSRRAVEFQLQNIRRKLNVLTTYQALGIAIKRKWI
ncbi:LuxR family transcriptional regulator [Mesorhizobium sp. B2-4-9]|uniref:autoinducer binding domain-containing protein n=1 Tax=Mesorhizobium sp. B2-4-9 TaxID=2589940 RepID=UPI00112A7B84|nr:autoinducer binding domain-containing protein [Mesorhizobium sp. B2-4-9]TPL21055.1 LuxR family transcriptional regulator [Mesorhizobium sp. B2-4-9]